MKGRGKGHSNGQTKERRRTTLGSDNASIAKGITQELKVGLLEEGLGRPLRVGTIGDDHIEFILAVSKELEAVTNVDLDIRVLEADAHAGKVFFGDSDDGLQGDQRAQSRLVG